MTKDSHFTTAEGPRKESLHAPQGLPGGSDGRESACHAGDLNSIPGLGRSPRRGHGNPLQYSCLKSPMDRGAWQPTVHGAVKNQAQLKRLSTHKLFPIKYFQTVFFFSCGLTVARDLPTDGMKLTRSICRSLL